MGPLSKTTTKPISSTLLNHTDSSSAPSLTHAYTSAHKKSHFAKKLALRVTGLLAIVSVLGISSAAMPTGSDLSSSKPSKDDQKTTDINLTGGADQTPKSSGVVSGSTVSNTSTTSGSAGDNSSSSYKTTVTVNGQPVAVPYNGNAQQVITTPDGSGTTTININHSTSNQGSNFSSNTTTTNSNALSNNVSQSTQIEQSYGSP